MQGKLTPYKPFEVTVKIGVSRDGKRLCGGAPDPYRSATSDWVLVSIRM